MERIGVNYLIISATEIKISAPYNDGSTSLVDEEYTLMCHTYN
jgi:hypothetical protein